MHRAVVAILVAIVTLTNSSAFSDPATFDVPAEPQADSAVSAVPIAPATDVAADASASAQSLDVLEQPSDGIPFPVLTSIEEICSTLEIAASVHALPVAFFARLIWQESRFKIDARSPVGARGIAQFMPGTAEWRGLANPLDPIESLRKSADYLRELREQFGNLGLAAAAYNGGSGRVQRWLDGRGKMPRETRDYVRVVTGSPIEEWRAKADATAVPAGRIPLKVPCPAMVAMAAISEPDPEVKKSSEETPRVASSKPRSYGKRATSRRQLAAARAARTKPRRTRSVVRGRKPSVASRRAPVRGRTAMNNVRAERRADRL
jgi:hypothetical protein